MTRYSKFFAALAGTAGVAASFLADGEVSQNDIIGIAASLLAAIGVYFARNQPTGV